MTFRVERVEPIGTRPTETMHGCIEVPKYPDQSEGERLRKHRVACGFGLREASRLVGMEAVEFSGLEFGGYRLIDPNDWQRLRDTLSAGKATPQ